jgi:hypothetical protein
LLGEFAGKKHEPETHAVQLRDGRSLSGTWEEIVAAMRDGSSHAGRSLAEYMATEARRGFSLTGAKIPTTDAETFLRASANAGLLRIVT